MLESSFPDESESLDLHSSWISIKWNLWMRIPEYFSEEEFESVDLDRSWIPGSSILHSGSHIQNQCDRYWIRIFVF